MMRTLLIALLIAGCGSIDPPPPTDEDGNEIIEPGPFDTYLGIEADYPDEVGVRPIIRLRVDGYIDEDELLDFGIVSLASAGITETGRVRWIMSTRTLEFRPFSELVPGLRYTPRIDGSRVFSVTGAPLADVSLPPVLVVDEPADDDPPTPAVRWPEVDRLLEAKCRSCHADPQWQLNPLTRESMIGQQSKQVFQPLVLPFDPGDSYLMRKVIADFPVRRFTVQPPPWSDLEPLTQAEVALLETWIRGGARL